jgi:hypothetical protein
MLYFLICLCVCDIQISDGIPWMLCALSFSGTKNTSKSVKRHENRRKLALNSILYPELSFLLRYTGTTTLHREWVDPSLFKILFITHIKLCSSLRLLEAQSNSFNYKKYKLLNNYRITQSSSPPANKKTCRLEDHIKKS